MGTEDISLSPAPCCEPPLEPHRPHAARNVAARPAIGCRTGRGAQHSFGVRRGGRPATGSMGGYGCPSAAGQAGERVAQVAAVTCGPPAEGAAGPSGAVSAPDRHRDDSDSPAAQFTRRALRIVLEVLDRRRGAGQLRAVADPKVVAAVQTLVTQDLVPGSGLGSAALTRVSTVPIDPRTAEIFGGYQRGDRRFAFAGRIRYRRGSWQLISLRMR